MEDPIAQQPHLLHRIFSHRVLITLIIVILLAIGAYLGLLYWSQTPPANFNFRVEETDSINSIADRLVTQGVMKHPLFFYTAYYAFGRQSPIEPGGYKLSSTMKMKDMVHILEGQPTTKFVVLPENASKDELAQIFTDVLGWDQLDLQFFGHTYAGMQWQHYQEIIKDVFQKKYAWNDTKAETFLTLSSLYYDDMYDFMKKMYISGTYEFPQNASRAQVASVLIDEFAKVYPTDRQTFEKFLDNTSALAVVKLIEKELVLMPDIVAIPPRDVTLKKVGDRTNLLFTASYWNKGRGPLELIPDPKNKGIKTDHERDVFQRIYSLDGNYTEKLSGKFLWHSPHLHYHFQDFAIYVLEPLEGTIEKQSQKSTFCVRDSEPIDLAHPGANKSASYKICGKERQGISPGWADSYFFTYIDQKFDVSGLPTGDYRLKIIINPEDRFEEMTKDNNVGEVIINLDVENNKVKVLSEKNHGIE